MTTRTIKECVELVARFLAGDDISDEMGGEPSDNFIKEFGPRSDAAKSLQKEEPVVLEDSDPTPAPKTSSPRSSGSRKSKRATSA